MSRRIHIDGGEANLHYTNSDGSSFSIQSDAAKLIIIDNTLDAEKRWYEKLPGLMVVGIVCSIIAGIILVTVGIGA